MRHLLFLFALSLGATARAVPSTEELAQATVVVYNRAAPQSASLARFYAEARHISDDHLVGLGCSTEEEISRQQYDETIAEPLRKIFAERKWWTLRTDADNQPTVTAQGIHFVALIRGMPLKIRATVDYPGDRIEKNQIGGQNQAGVDSELATLGLFSRQISGAANNPYFQSFRSIAELGAPILLVCRLDAPTDAIVRRMITDAVEIEKNGLWGRAYVDGANHASGGLADGDEWLAVATKDLREVGIPVTYDTSSALFPSGFPMNDCALYYGWYAGGVAGPFADPGFAFLRGAVAVHIHSYSANTLRSAEANWVGPLLAKGATASLGNVYEPYLQLTAHLDIFNDRLLHGFTFAESASMATRVLSWMNVAVGDPLYRPYASWLQLDAKRDNNRRKTDWRMYHDFAVKNSRRDPADYLSAARLAASRADNGPMLEDLGMMEKERANYASAIGYFRQARALYKKPDDSLRALLEQADASFRSGDKEGALALIRGEAKLLPEGPAAALLQRINQEINPPPPTPGLTPSPTP